MTARYFASLFAAALLVAATAGAQSGADLLQKGIYTQETLGDLDGAVGIYRQITASATKPFKLRELVARVNAFLRRRQAGQESVTRFGEFELDVAAHKLFRAGKEVELTAKEFRLLAHFAARAGRALARNDILDAVWGDSVIVTPRSIDRCVTTLRAKIEPDPHNPTHIQTIRDIGYRFETGDA